MKSTLSFLLLALLFVFNSCKEIDKLLTFTIKESQTFTVPKQFIIPGRQLPGMPVPSAVSMEQEFKNHNTRANLVKNITLDDLTLTIENPATEDFGFLKDIDVFISTDNTNEAKLAYLHDIPANVGNTLKLNSANPDLMKYINAENFKIRANATIDESVPDDVTMKIDVIFKVVAKSL
ncbi:hypothetical protein [Adhaeribacter aquaticus]|uniref:hypothetical protein n=1 Tax=Adhaeribacter aquaticus TaxID=299567 RepID=UPI0008FEEEE7|nr:hypothetical protein [Adhaeribacter aquaticus]